MDTLEKVIEGCQNADEAMQAELYKRYSPRFYALARRYAPDDETAREILTDGFLAIFNDIENYRGDGSFEGWMQTIFIRKAIKAYNVSIRHRRMQLNPDKEDFPYTPDDVGRQIDIREALIKALQFLSDKERRVFNLVAVEEYTMTDAAELLGLPESTVKSQYYRAQETLKRKIMRILGRDYLKN